MRIIEIDSIESIVSIHEQIFGTPFPYDSYKNKSMAHKLYVYAYYEKEKIVGYSIVVDQADEKNLYAWYGGLLAEYQGNGTTVKFFDILVEKAKALQYLSISLATTNCRPNMLRLAVKYGFDIYDIKKRDCGEGNKIYFKYYLYPDSSMDISLINDDGSKLKVSELEKTLVFAYKHNCSKIVFSNVLEESDIDMLTFAKRYCQKFLRPIEFELSGDMNIITQISD